MKAETAKLILLIAGILGIVQGLMALVGGLVAAHDYSTDDIPDVLSTHITIGKYWCGMMRGTGTTCPPESLDRGWFYRTYKAIKDETYTYTQTYSSYSSTTKTVDKDKLKELTGYEAVVSYAIICGIGWMAAGALAILASLKRNKTLAIVAGIIFAVLYGLFIGLFGAVWDSVKKVEDDCKPLFDSSCSDLKKNMTKSSREFLGYSICSFVLILAAIAGCFMYFFVKTEGDTAGMVAANMDKSASSIGAGAAKDPGVSAVSNLPPPPPPMTKKPEEKAADKKDAKFVAAGPSTAAPVAPAAPAAPMPKKKNPLAEQFIGVNKYLTDDAKLTQSAQKQFAAIDTDRSGKMSFHELKKFITNVMVKKNLPEPSNEKVRVLMAKYDKDKSGTLERPEFKNMLYDIFSGSREILIKRYAESKAEAIKGSKPAVTDTAGAMKLSELLKDTDAFYQELTKVAHEVDKDKSNTLSIDEVTALVAKFCGKYNVPVLSKAEILEVMEEMEHSVKEYNIPDLRMISLAVLSIAKCMVTSK